ncbi:phosphonoacetaldehyde hydrolase [Companilactobacillus baiquanensis]|uniref:Phosphonoacetaldehyde hydrolase n=1 Tax=Companilactobacillus baiquanensis TaxID=2486005 RepID=A0ABW1UVA7_9LACO|nr:phosphonoacetaldehyde hydrolase [Companilactobacillus baiquanensis]
MIKAVVFDWAGTTVDYGSLAPVIAFKAAFSDAGIEINDQEIRRDMGITKWDHIGKLLKMPDIFQQWEKEYNRLPDFQDRRRLYEDFQSSLLFYVKDSTSLKPATLDAFNYLKDQGIRVATTTGYTPEMMQLVKDSAFKLGYQPELVLTSDDVDGDGRPSPRMIQKIMNEFGLSDPKELVKIGDTIVDIEEGKNAGVNTIGIVEGSSLMGLSEKEFNSLFDEEKESIRQRVVNEFAKVNADIIINNLSELPDAIKFLNQSEEKIANGK